MKIAVCFFGITRNLREHTLDSIERHLFAPIAQRDPGFQRFAHFNQVRQLSNPRSGESNVAIAQDQCRLLGCQAAAETDQDWLDTHLDYKTFEAFGDAWQDNFSSLRNLLRQLHSLNQVTELLLRSGQEFDFVIYTRADLRFERTVEIPRFRPRTLYTPWFGKSGGLNDRFGIGDLQTMVKYGQRGTMALQYCQETGRPLHAERLLGWCARKHHLRCADLTSIQFCRVRADGSIPAPDRIVKYRLKYRIRRAWNHWKNFALGQGV
jgi:hypothetical protein